MSLEYEPSSEPLHISAKWLFLNSCAMRPAAARAAAAGSVSYSQKFILQSTIHAVMHTGSDSCSAKNSAAERTRAACFGLDTIRLIHVSAIILLVNAIILLVSTTILLVSAILLLVSAIILLVSAIIPLVSAIILSVSAIILSVSAINTISEHCNTARRLGREEVGCGTRAACFAVEG